MAGTTTSKDSTEKDVNTLQIQFPPELAAKLNEISQKLDQLTASNESGHGLWDTERVAKHLCCNRDTVRRKARSGELRVARRVGSKMLFDPSQFQSSK